MDKLLLYMDVVSLPALIVTALMMGIIYLIMPAETRFYFTFLIMPAWLVVARSPDLGAAQAFAKISSPLLFLLVAVAAYLRPVPKRTIPGIAWIYVLGGCYVFLCLIGVEHNVDALVVQAQWILLVLAALAMVSTLTTIEDLEKLAKVITVGMVLALAIPISAVIIHPSELFGNIGRFSPWGAHPNLIGVAFLMAAPFLLYTIMTSRSLLVRSFLTVVLLGDIGMALVTGSRQVVFSMGAALGLMCFPLFKRPGIVLLGVLAGLIVLPFFVSMNQEAFERLGSLDSSGRLDLWFSYLKISFQRPLGLFGTSGLNSHIDVTIGDHPHNALLEMLYLGGWPYFLSMAFVIIISMRSTMRVWKARNLYETPKQRFLIHTYASILVAMFLQSLSNQVIFHPTYAWSFLCVVLTMQFIAMARELPYLEEEHEWRLEQEDEAWDHEEYSDDEDSGYDDYEQTSPA